MRRARLFAAIMGLAFIFSSASILIAQEYEIRLARKAKQGEKFRLSTTGLHSEKMVALVGNKPVNAKSDEFSVDLVASVTVLETNDQGDMTRYALGVEKCVITANGSGKALAVPGTIIVAAAEGPGMLFKINDTLVDPLTAKALEIVLPPPVKGVTDDDVFGTREKKKVGDSWDINAQVAAASFKEALNLSAAKEDIKGASTLDGVVKGAKEDYLVVSAWLSVDKFSLPLPNVTLQSGQLKAVFSGRFPINQAHQSLEQSLKMAIRFIGSRPPDPKTPEMTFQGVFERSVRREIALLE